MANLYPARLSESSRPILVKGEVERGMLDKVDMRFDGSGGVETHPSSEYKDGYLVLTNYRFIWLARQTAGSGAEPPPPTSGVPCHLPLSAVANVEYKNVPFKAARIKLSVRVNSRGYPVASALDVERVLRIKLVCRGPSPDTWRMQLETSVSRAAWAHLPPGVWQELLELPASSNPAAGPLQQAAAGGGGEQRQQRQQQQQQPSQGQAFRPDPLMLHDLISMGFIMQRAVNGLLATNNAGVQEAADWLLEHSQSPIVDYPNPYDLGPAQAAAFGPPAVAAAGAALQRQLSLGGVGVAGVLRREEQRAAATETALDQAFTDLSQLMDKARDMVALAEYFRERMTTRAAADGSAAGGAAGEGGEEELDAATALDLVNLGIISPVTRETAGSLYHQELSRQLADFLAGPVERSGGLMPLPDAYCLFNRARGSELVSPDDLLQAIKLFPTIRANLRLREFASGVKVVQAASHSDERVCERLRTLVQPASDEGADGGGSGAGPRDAGEALWRGSLGAGVTQTEAAAALSVPVAVAAEHLLMAEGAGVLCRDDGPEGLRFFRNFFADYVSAH